MNSANGMNLRDWVGIQTNKRPEGYGCVVREERFFCAVLFHLVLTVMAEKDRNAREDGLRNILLRLKVPEAMMPEPEAVRVFVEYAMARDLWNVMVKKEDANVARKEFIFSWIKRLPERFRQLDTKDFNREFVSGPVSKLYIQSPARWGLKNILKRLDDTDCIIEACKLKWAFNIKPDIVIELGKNAVVCIEAKVESGEGQYLSSEDLKAMREKSEDLAAKIASQSNQCVIQKFLMEELLGYKSHHVFLNMKFEDTDRHGVNRVKWLSLLDGIEDTNPTVQVALDRIRNWKGEKDKY